MNRSPWVWLLFPGLTMSLGWGLRGFIGGGPLGAMIPGVMAALALALLVGRDDAECGLVAAFGAVGVGFGGQMTYGQTVGLTFQPETFWWGFTGFAVKGAVWGLAGGAALGLALDRDKFSLREILTGLLLMIGGTYLGWKLVNEPKLIYFSDPVNKPRAEIWAGLLLGAAVLLGWLARMTPSAKLPLRFALWGALGGGVGFAAGAWFQAAGRQHLTNPWIDYWKAMELTFGFCLGAAYGWCAKKSSGAPGPAKSAPTGTLWPALAGGLILIVLAHWMEETGTSRFSYTIVGAGLMAAALYSERLGWLIGAAMTHCAFAYDLLENKPHLNQAALWVWVAASTLAVAYLVSRWQSKKHIFLLITWSAVIDSLLKSFLPPAALGGHVVTEIVFVVFAALVSYSCLSCCAESERSSSS
ncbi:MAG: hypothetical protein HY822_25570 [Acidobacteria bacterium]|nr:hypothetical protein [Acidobacteriota bacterium]